MKSAKELFEELGYKKISDTNISVTFLKKCISKYYNLTYYLVIHKSGCNQFFKCNESNEVLSIDAKEAIAVIKYLEENNLLS